MEFDSPDPEVEKEFPGLYKAEGPKEMNDPVEYDEDLDKKKKKKDDKKKDKGYATLAGESSNDDEDGVDSNPGKKKLKGFILSGKKKDKDKDKDKDVKKSEKDKDGKKLDKEKVKKRADSSERKSADRDVPFSSVRIPFSGERHRDINAHRASVPAAFFSTVTPKTKTEAEAVDKPSSGSVLNAFLNAPAPLFLPKKKEKKDKDHKKDKEHKKDKDGKESKKDKDKKEHTSGVAKVKLKLMRSKNSLEDPHEKGDLHVSVSHQFPEDPESLAKEIKKHEQLLEQTHAQVKSGKKVSKKHEEQLWELQRTLTQLKRKLRSINALSFASITSGIPNPVAAKDCTEQLATYNPPTNTIPAPKPEVSTKSNAVTSPPIQQGQALEHAKSEMQYSENSSNHFQAETANTESLPTFPTSSFVKCGQSVSAYANVQRSAKQDTSLATQRPSARRTLDFSDIIVDNDNSTVDVPDTSAPVSLPSLPSPPSKGFINEKHPLSDNGKAVSEKVESPIELEREKVEVHVLVHNESRDDDNISSVGTCDDLDEAVPSISSRNDENIGNVVDDANAMIGSMHEELEAAALVFGQKIPRDDRTGNPKDFVLKSINGPQHHSFMSNISKSEPTFGEQANDSSDIELIRDDEDDILENFTDELIPEILNLPLFETPEYLMYENDQLSSFNRQIQEDITKEEADLEALVEELETLSVNENGEIGSEECDVERLISIWKVVKSENEALHVNVSRLRQLVALDRLEEFKLETRLKYLEDKILPISPITTTTPLQSEP